MSILNTLRAGHLADHRIRTSEGGYRFCRLIQGEEKSIKCFKWFMEHANGRWAWQHTPWRSQGEYLIFLDDEDDILYFTLTY